MWSGIILAGGPNRRMGEPKALLQLGGETMVARQVRVMRSVCNEIIVVTNDPIPYLRVLDRDVRIITDYYKGGRGPLAGMHAGLMLASHPHAWIASCDLPYLNAEAAAVLRGALRAGRVQAAVPNVNGGLYPLHGVYDRTCAAHAARLIEQGETAASALLREVAWTEVRETDFAEKGIPSRFVVTLNDKRDYEAVKSEVEHSANVS